jgi:hypothetical protein
VVDDVERSFHHSMKWAVYYESDGGVVAVTARTPEDAETALTDIEERCGPETAAMWRMRLEANGGLFASTEVEAQ